MAWVASTVAPARTWWSIRIQSRSSSCRPTMRVWRQSFAHRQRRRRCSRMTRTRRRRPCTMCRFTRCSARDLRAIAMPMPRPPQFLPRQTAWMWKRTRLRPPLLALPTRPVTRCRLCSRPSCRRERASFRRHRRRQCPSWGPRLRIGRRAPIAMLQRPINPVQARRRHHHRRHRHRPLPLPLQPPPPHRPPR